MFLLQFHVFYTTNNLVHFYKIIGISRKTFLSEVIQQRLVDKSSWKLGRGGAIGKTRGSESDDRSPLVSGSNPVAAAFAFAKLRKKFRRVQNHNQEGCG